MKKINFLLSLCLTLLFMSSCSKDDPSVEIETDKLIIAKATLSNDEEITLMGDHELTVGYQKVYIQLTKDGRLQTSSNITFSPIMDMGSMTHGAPSSALSYANQTNSYEGYVVFTMPSSDSGSWELKFNVNGEEISIPIRVKAAATGNLPVKSFTASNNKGYVIALVDPATPKIGVNELELMIFLKETMFSFPEQNGLTLDFDPQMTSMNHGSPNNVSPVASGNGRYKGKVNFTMTGDWRLFFDIKEGNTELAKDVYLDVLF
ncbi:FixH family protein [Sphingobacterium sp. BN32]|uniref:FixH family protein n=1 Tax=Sphingobacterium sp. BN32 TaxID=3058432 RepID=UPI00265CDFD3|nr:FixH family protein [Sphingobacterium sp. BN32]WKK59522.1 FixH family protein [Sphingobacterium sp. BN32]